MKVLCLEASARRQGNTARLLSAAAGELHALGARVETVHLPGLQIAGCLGCGQCLTDRHRGECVQQDDMTGLYPAVREADGLILASPVYMWHMTAWAKAFVDRLYCLTENGDMAGKRLSFVSTGGGDPFDGMDLIAASLKRYCDYAKMAWVDPLFRAPAGDWKDWDGAALERDARAFAQRFVDAGK